VLGADPRLWLLPVYGGGPAGDGVHWPVHVPPREEESEGDVEEGGAVDARLLEAGGGGGGIYSSGEE